MMTRGFQTMAVLGALVALSTTSGCTFTNAGTKRPPTEPAGSIFRPRIEHTTGDFGFAWGEAALTPSTIDGYLLSSEIMDAWAARGYAVPARFVEAKEFSGKAEYQLTLSGSQRNAASFFLETLNALTLMLFPYPVTQHYDLTYVLEDRMSGKTYSATVQGWDVTYVGLLVLPAFPFAPRGHRATMQEIGDNLYEQFRLQGAFEYPCPANACGVAMTKPTVPEVCP